MSGDADDRGSAPSWDWVGAPHNLNLSVAHRSSPGQVVMAVTGELDILTAPFFREVSIRVASTLEEGTVVVLDVRGVTMIDSAGVGPMVSFLKRARAHGAHVVLAHPQPVLVRFLGITGLSAVFPVESWRLPS